MVVHAGLRPRLIGGASYRKRCGSAWQMGGDEADLLGREQLSERERNNTESPLLL